VRDLAETGVRVIAVANDQLGFTHPEGAGWDHISFCQFAGPLTRQEMNLRVRTPWSSVPARLTARRQALAVALAWPLLSAHGLMGEGDVYRARSIIGSEFICRIACPTTIGGRPAIIPAVSGRAWITGVSQYMLDPADPRPSGYGFLTHGRALGSQFCLAAR
jgi:trans-L-3-hydroxyproline dehydratase